jgi:AGZA family xanthine/uracil permease-like MFS transporter
MLNRLESYFEFTRLGTNWRTEILAGVTTFLTMAYIVLVNPAILAALFLLRFIYMGAS